MTCIHEISQYYPMIPIKPYKNNIPSGSLWQTNIPIENGPFIDDFPIKNGDCP